MHIVMNNFKIKIGREEEFEEVWRNRDSHLDGVPGFLEKFDVSIDKSLGYFEYNSQLLPKKYLIQK